MLPEPNRGQAIAESWRRVNLSLPTEFKQHLVVDMEEARRKIRYHRGKFGLNLHDLPPIDSACYRSHQTRVGLYYDLRSRRIRRQKQLLQVLLTGGRNNNKETVKHTVELVNTNRMGVALGAGLCLTVLDSVHKKARQHFHRGTARYAVPNRSQFNYTIQTLLNTN